MDYYCEVCDKFIKPKSKYKHFISNIYKEFNICKHMELPIENPNICNIDEVFSAYIIQHNKQHDHCFIKCHFILVFIDNQHSIWIKFNLFDNKTLVS